MVFDTHCGQFPWAQFGFEPRYGLFSVVVVFDTHCGQFRSFLAFFGTFLGHIVQLKGKKGLLVTGQSGRKWNVGTVSLRLAVLSGLGGFRPKRAVFGHKMRSIRRAPPKLATGEFLAQTLDLATAPPRLYDG